MASYPRRLGLGGDTQRMRGGKGSRECLSKDLCATGSGRIRAQATLLLLSQMQRDGSGILSTNLCTIDYGGAAECDSGQ